jgi:hypothetical protein
LLLAALPDLFHIPALVAKGVQSRPFRVCKTALLRGSRSGTKCQREKVSKSRKTHLRKRRLAVREFQCQTIKNDGQELPEFQCMTRCATR